MRRVRPGVVKSMTVNVKNAANSALGAAKAQIKTYVLPLVVGVFVVAFGTALLGKKLF